MPSNVFLNVEPENGPLIGAAMRQASDSTTMTLEGAFMAIQKGNGGMHPKGAAEYLERLDALDTDKMDEEYREPFVAYRERLREKLDERNVDYRDD